MAHKHSHPARRAFLAGVALGRAGRGHGDGHSRRAVSTGAGAVGALATGAFALGALAIGSLAIGRLAVKRGMLGSVEVRELRVDRLTVGELIVERERRAPAVSHGDTAGAP